MTSIDNINTNLKTNDITEKNNDSQHVLLNTGAAAIAITGCTILCGKLSIKSLTKALKSQGAELKDGVAIISETGEKFSGTIKRKIGTFGQKRETIKFENGLMTEKIYHNVFGKELEGEFYKSGILRLKVGQGKLYSLVKYNSDGKCESISDCMDIKGHSKFDSARKFMNNLN